jgi:hypothetical protein
MAARKAIPTETKLRLFSEAAGRCQRPACLRPLFPAEMGGDKHIAEMAHVIPSAETGPRNEQRPSGDYEVDSFENLVLLCPTCHTIIDKDPTGYSRSTLLDWKRNHIVAVAFAQGIRTYEKRSQDREALIAAMEENQALWHNFAPSDGSHFEYDPESETAKNWDQRMLSVILPNHFRIQAIIKANIELMTEVERQIFAQYQEHVRGLAERHICGLPGGAIRYPAGMNGVFE